jgi:sugar/nucleoside kinase (ribokinase family)
MGAGDGAGIAFIIGNANAKSSEIGITDACRDPDAVAALNLSRHGSYFEDEELEDELEEDFEVSCFRAETTGTLIP